MAAFLNTGRSEPPKSLFPDSGYRPIAVLGTVLLDWKTSTGLSWLGLFLDSSVIGLAYASTLRVMHENTTPLGERT